MLVQWGPSTRILGCTSPCALAPFRQLQLLITTLMYFYFGSFILVHYFWYPLSFGSFSAGCTSLTAVLALQHPPVPLPSSRLLIVRLFGFFQECADEYCSSAHNYKSSRLTGGTSADLGLNSSCRFPGRLGNRIDDCASLTFDLC